MTDQAQATADDSLETLRFLSETPGKLSQLIEGFTAAEVRWQSAGEFSPLESICHLRDLEVEGYGVRIGQILEETNPWLPDFDGARVAAERNYLEENPATAIQELAEARRNNLQRLRNAKQSELNREGTLEGVGTITLLRLIEMMREHDEGHIEEMRVLRQQIEKRRP